MSTIDEYFTVLYMLFHYTYLKMWTFGDFKNLSERYVEQYKSESLIIGNGLRNTKRYIWNNDALT